MSGAAPACREVQPTQNETHSSLPAGSTCLYSELLSLSELYTHWFISLLSTPSTAPTKMRGIVVQWLNYVQFFVTPWTAARQASLSFTISQSLLKLMFIESVMPSNHLILCCPLLLLPSIFPSIRVFSNESVLWIRWLKYWSFSFSISPSKEYIACLFIYHIPPMHSLANNRYSINVGLMN